MNIKYDFHDKTVIVTGCASGIGRGIATAFGKAGANVIAADINEEGAEETVSIIKKDNPNAKYLPLDITKQDSIENMIADTKKTFGGIDIIVNNAGVVGAVKGYPLTGLSSEDWDKNYQINLKGLFLSCRSIYKTFLEQKSGKIINMASIAGKTGDATDLALIEYATIKSAVIHFTQLLSKEMGPYNINVNCICPGFVYTPLYEYAAPKIKEKYPDLLKGKNSAEEVVNLFAEEWCALKRPQTPEDIANMAMYLASEEAKNITGQAINVCGGCESH